MESYTEFAKIYDKFMENTPYDEWRDFLVSRLKREGIEEGLVCELGSGTGEMTRRLRDEGYDMIGIDNSSDMLNISKEKEGDREDILYLLQDMTEFELYGTVRAIISVCDSVNYVENPSKLLKTFKLCNNYLDPGGLLIFDFNTPFKYKGIGDSTIADYNEDAAFIWDNFYDEETEINEYDITFFNKTKSGLYERFTETHIQRGYSLSNMKSLIEKAGLKFLEAYDGYSMKQACDEAERIVMVCKEQGK